jgi:hypothetical protein
MAMTDSMKSTITVEVEVEADTKVTAEEVTGAGEVRAATSGDEDEVAAVVVGMVTAVVHGVAASAAVPGVAEVSRLIHILSSITFEAIECFALLPPML